MASSFTLPSSIPSTFTHPPPSSQFPPHAHPLSLSFLHPPLYQVAKKSWNNVIIAKAQSQSSEVPKSDEPVVVTRSSQEQKWVHEGLITESLPNGMFRVRLDNEDVILGYVCGKIRSKFIRIVQGDKVKIEVSRYDSTRGRIVYRMDSESKIRTGKAQVRQKGKK